MVFLAETVSIRHFWRLLVPTCAIAGVLMVGLVAFYARPKNFRFQLNPLFCWGCILFLCQNSVPKVLAPHRCILRAVNFGPNLPLQKRSRAAAQLT